MSELPGFPRRWRCQLDESTARRARENHGFVHRLLMSLLPDRTFDGISPRASARLLWGFVGPRALVVSSDVEPRRGQGVEFDELPPIRPLATQGTINATVTLERTYTPVAWVPPEIWNLPDRPAIRNKRMPVPDAELGRWFDKKLQRCGIDVRNIVSRETAELRVDKRHIPSVTVHFEGVVTDADLANGALQGGVGRSKNYGCGLLLPAAPQSN